MEGPKPRHRDFVRHSEMQCPVAMEGSQFFGGFLMAHSADAKQKRKLRSTAVIYCFSISTALILAAITFAYLENSFATHFLIAGVLLAVWGSFYGTADKISSDDIKRLKTFMPRAGNG